MSRLPDEFRRPGSDGHTELDGREGDRAPRERPDEGPDVGCEPHRDQPTAEPSTAAVMARYAANEARRAGRGIRELAWIRQRPPSAEDRYVRVRRVADELDGMVPLLRGPYLAGEYVAATLATVIQLTAQSVGTLPGLLTTAAVILTVLQVALGVPF